MRVSEHCTVPGPLGVAGLVSVLSGLLQTQTVTRARPDGGHRGGGRVQGSPRRALTICPTHTLAASIMAPSAMERADSFSMCGFPESSSSTTCHRGGDKVTAGLPGHTGRGGGRSPGRAGSILYISIFFQGDAAIAV